MRGGIRFVVVGAMPLNDHCTEQSEYRERRLPSSKTRSAAEPADEPDLAISESGNACGKRKAQTFHHSSARPARRVIRRTLGGLLLEVMACANEVKHSCSLSWPRCLGRFATVEKGLKSYG